MSNWSVVNRPVTIPELSAALGETIARFERLIARHDIEPACRIGRIRLFGPRQVRRIYRLTRPHDQSAPGR